MAKRNNIEHQIRDYLASNLSIIEPRLTLIETEFYLKRSSRNASNGFIDILAKNEYNQLVVIEIKRSKSSSRTAIHEILKYKRLLKEEYNVKNGEVKFIILSTKWEELINPFSELYQLSKNDLSVKGYKITWKNNQIVDKEQIIPIEFSNQRSISPVQKIYLYEENGIDFQKGIKQLKHSFSRIGISNYVILHLSNSKQYIKNILYPYGLYVVFSRLNEYKYLEIFNIEEGDELNKYFESYIDGLISKDDYLKELESCVYNHIYINSNSSEHGYPEKLDLILNEQGWSVFDTYRSGIFKNPMFELEDIIIEITAIKGQNIGQYKNYTYYEKYDKVRLAEVFRETQYCLKNNANWLAAVKSIHEYIKSKNEYQSITINIYNPPSILNLIYRFSIGDDGYLPLFIISIFNKEQNIFEVFKGQISWNGNDVDKQSLLNLLPMNNGFKLMSALTTDSFREEYEYVLGIEFEVFYCVNVLKNNTPLNKRFYPIEFDRNCNIQQIESYNYDLNELVLYNQASIKYIKDVIRSNSFLLR